MNTFGCTRRKAIGMAIAGTALAFSIGSAWAQPVPINFWDMQWGGPKYPVAAAKLVARYNAEHPNVNVVYRSVPWSNWYETFVTAIASGSAPDVSTGASFQAVQLYDQGAILPLDELVAQLDPTDFGPGALDAMKFDGHYVGLPWGFDPRVLFYRKDLLTAAGVEVPENWQQFRTAAKALTGGGKYGLVSSGDPSGMHWILTSMINNNGGAFDVDGKPALTSERSLEALRFLASLVADGSVNPASVGYRGDDARGSFVRGEAAFLLNNVGVLELAPEQKPNIGIVPPLSGPHGDKGTFSSVNNIMAYSQTEHREETFAFMAWWSENALPLWTEGGVGNLPVRNSIADDAYFQNNPSIKYVIENYLPVGRPLSAQAPGTFPQLNAVDGDGFLLSLVQSIWQGQPVEGNAEKAQAHLEELMVGR